MTLYFRPHHFLCALNFQGRGYSPAFTANLQRIIDTINRLNGDESVICVTIKSDSICAPCPNRVGDSCETADKIQVLDTAHMNALGIQPKQQLTWHQAKQLISEKISLDVFHQICATCSWKSLGICEASLKAHLNIQESTDA